MRFENISEYGINFKQLISGPAPVGRILNYVNLMGQGILRHRNGYRSTDLDQNIASAWCSEFMVGLGLGYYEKAEDNGPIVPFVLTEDGKSLYELIKDYQGKFDESTNPQASKTQLQSLNNGAYEVFFDLFKKSVVCRNLCNYIIARGKRVFNKYDFKNDYFELFMMLYETGGNYNRDTRTTAADNRVPSLIQLCLFFECVKENDENYIFDFDKLRVNEVDETIKNTDNKLPVRSERTTNGHALNSILYGPPGTGKTYATTEYALSIIDNRPINEKQLNRSERKALVTRYKRLVDNGQIVFTTFHQSYSYEDFIQGLRPNSNNESLSFEPFDGVFKKIADKALMDMDNNYVIIIDEINRANISKVFGELITLIEDDKRWGEINELSAILPSGDAFTVPNNLYIVGTMNSADKSISLIDSALRRRFQFIEVIPNSDLIEDNTMRKIFIRLNEKLVTELDSTDLLIGHAYFMGKSVNELSDIMNRSIIPLLYEYFYDNKKKVKSFVNDALDELNFEIEDPKVGRINVIRKG